MTRSLADEMLHAIVRLNVNERWPNNAITDANVSDIVREIWRRRKTSDLPNAELCNEVIIRFTALYPLKGKDWTKPYSELVAAKTA